MQTINALPDEYGDSHVNPVHKVIRWICLPLIEWTVASLPKVMLVLVLM